MGLVFVLGTIASMGLSLTMQQITGPLRNARFVIIALLANFILPPIFVFVLIRIFSLDESLAVGLQLVSLAAGAPALGAGQRNIAAAMVVATMNFGNDEVVMVVVYSLITLLVMTSLALELGKRTSKKA